MRVSTKGRYALRLMLELAKTSDTYISIREISERQDISHKYLEQIIIQLVRVGYVRSIRGPQGGYSLALDPAQITCGMILRVMEGSLAPVACIEEGPQACSRSKDCETQPLWEQLKKAIDGVVDSITLQDLLDKTEKPQIGMWL